LIILCLIFTALVVFCAIFGSLVAPHDPNEQDLLNTLQQPSWDHLFGTNTLGVFAGYRGGRADFVIMRFCDLMFALPALLVAIVVVGVLGGGYWLAVT